MRSLCSGRWAVYGLAGERIRACSENRRENVPCDWSSRLRVNSASDSLKAGLQAGFSKHALRIAGTEQPLLGDHCWRRGPLLSDLVIAAAQPDIGSQRHARWSSAVNVPGNALKHGAGVRVSRCDPSRFGREVRRQQPVQTMSRVRRATELSPHHHLTQMTILSEAIQGRIPLLR